MLNKKRCFQIFSIKKWFTCYDYTKVYLQTWRGTYSQVWGSAHTEDSLVQSPLPPKLSGWSDGPGKREIVKYIDMVQLMSAVYTELLHVLPQPCGPPHSGCSEWNKPLRRPSCVRQNDVIRWAKISTNSEKWARTLYPYTFNFFPANMQSSKKAEMPCELNMLRLWKCVCILLTKPEEGRIQSKCGRIWSAARCRKQARHSPLPLTALFKT